MRRQDRINSLWYAAAAATLLVIAHLLTPDPRGFGTHERLIPVPCYFRALTGLPCPGCGLTTSVCEAAEGHWRRSFSDHYLGPAVYITAWIILAWSLASILLGGALGVKGPHMYLSRRRLWIVLLTIYLGAWVVRLVLLFSR